MTASQPSLIIPVEVQVRELDSKILLAVVAALRGFSVILGSRLEVDCRIASFPRGIYLSKSMTRRSVKMFRIMEKLGHQIVAWDEEALVHYPPEVYFTRRLSSQAIRYVSHFFAWGRDNAELWRQYPEFPSRPVHLTGNPRGDMLRPELHPYFQTEADRLRRQHGTFLLINTNFGSVNALVPSQNLVFAAASGDSEAVLGSGARGMTREFALGRQRHLKGIFEHFQRLIPRLHQVFPQLNLVLRPHPDENPGVYHRLADRLPRLKVINNGNVIPWLMACKALIHNGCTTGVEAYLAGVPALAYQPTVDDGFDNHLPNVLSHPCFDFEQLRNVLDDILAGRLDAAESEKRQALMAQFLEAREGALASERIADILTRIWEEGAMTPNPPLLNCWQGRYLATRRRLKKWGQSLHPQSKYRPEVLRHRYPGISLQELNERMTRLQKILKIGRPLQTEQIGKNIFRIFVE